jgi:hypothetical protein
MLGWISALMSQARLPCSAECTYTLLLIKTFEVDSRNTARSSHLFCIDFLRDALTLTEYGEFQPIH